MINKTSLRTRKSAAFLSPTPIKRPRRSFIPDENAFHRSTPASSSLLVAGALDTVKFGHLTSSVADISINVNENPLPVIAKPLMLSQDLMKHEIICIDGTADDMEDASSKNTTASKYVNDNSLLETALTTVSHDLLELKSSQTAGTTNHVRKSTSKKAQKESSKHIITTGKKISTRRFHAKKVAGYPIRCGTRFYHVLGEDEGVYGCEGSTEIYPQLFKTYLSEFTDVDENERIFLVLWNTFHVQYNGFGVLRMYKLVLKFIEKHYDTIQKLKLQVPWNTFLLYLKNTNTITEHQFFTLSFYRTPLADSWNDIAAPLIKK